MSSHNNSVDLNQKTLFIMSGASRGIGRTMAIECAAKLATGSVIVLLARSVNGLEETKAQILAKNPKNVTVIIFSIDLTRPSSDQIKHIFDTTLSERSVADFQLAIIVHSIGTLGDVTKLAKEFDEKTINDWHDYYSINVFSVVALNAAFLTLFEANKIRRLVVNITSKCGIVPCKSFTQYCSGKAAREMYFRVLALEEATTDSTLTVINYSPGPVQTEMTAYAEANSAASDVRTLFHDMRKEQTILQPIETTLKFLQIIETGAYASGDHVDYYD